MADEVAADVVVVDGPAASILAKFLEAGLVDALDGRGVTPGEREVLSPILRLAKDYRHPAPVRPSEPTLAVDSEASEAGRWIGTTEAAQRIGISTRAVVDAVARGSLKGRRVGRGRGVWQVSEASVETYEVKGSRPRGRVA